MTWKDRFITVFQIATDTELIPADRVAKEVHPDWFDAPNGAHYWVSGEYPQMEFFVAIQIQYHGRVLIGAFRVRNDSFYYGSTLYEGNHDWSTSELTESIIRAVKRKREED